VFCVQKKKKIQLLQRVSRIFLGAKPWKLHIAVKNLST
jgi:hypothetical protein